MAVRGSVTTLPAARLDDWSSQRPWLSFAVAGVVPGPAEIYKPAVRVNAPAIIMAHNHPSTDSTPSPEDLEVTRTTEQAGSQLRIQLLDHIVVGLNRWVSIRDQEQGFKRV